MMRSTSAASQPGGGSGPRPCAFSLAQEPRASLGVDWTVPRLRAAAVLESAARAAHCARALDAAEG